RSPDVGLILNTPSGAAGPPPRRVDGTRAAVAASLLGTGKAGRRRGPASPLLSSRPLACGPCGPSSVNDGPAGHRTGDPFKIVSASNAPSHGHDPPVRG